MRGGERDGERTDDSGALSVLDGLVGAEAIGGGLELLLELLDLKRGEQKAGGGGGRMQTW